MDNFKITREGFNSRTREGATRRQTQKNKSILVSIHAPVRVRLSVNDFDVFFTVSIHAPVRVRLLVLVYLVLYL